MSKFQTFGLGELARDLKKLGDDAETVTEEMLSAAAPVLEEAWKDEVTKRGFVDSGSMRDNVKSKVSMKKKTVETYPRKKDKKGTSNAAKAYVLHHGRKGNKNGKAKIKATYFVNDIAEKGGTSAVAVMKNVLDQNLKEKGL